MYVQIKIAFFTSLAALAICAAAADTELPAQLRSADQLAQSRPAEALAVLQRFDTESPSAAVPVRRELLLRLRRAHLDLGDYAADARVSLRLRELGQQKNDPASLAYAALTDIDEHLRGYRPGPAKAELDRISKLADLQAFPDLAFAIDMAYGRMYLLQADYERAIERFQNGIKLSTSTAHPAGARVEAMMNVAYSYTGLHDYAGAFRVVNEAFEADDGSLRARTRSLLHLTRALSLIDLKRMDDADQEFARALALSRQSGLRIVEARILADWVDLALRRERYSDAERMGREALRVAEAIGDAGTGITARANIGFALGGQGKVAEGLVFIDQVIDHFRKQGNSQALLSMLDEKGNMLQRQGMLKETVEVLREQQKLERAQFTEQRSKAVAALQERFEHAQNQRRIELLKEQNRLKDAVIQNRDLQRLALGLVVVLMLVVGGFVALLYRRAGRSNSTLRELNVRLAETAVRDPLTGLYNRRSFVGRMQDRTGRGDTDNLLILDLDHFKQVNDVHGHAAGDAVLVEVARRLQATVRDSDTVLRWGGEEFVIHSPGCGPQQGEALARRVLDAIGGAPIDANGVALPVTASIGMIGLPFAGLSDAECDWERALRLADAALYLAKSGGRNRCCQLLGPVEPLTVSGADIEGDLGAAIAAGHVRLQTILPQALAAAALI